MLDTLITSRTRIRMMLKFFANSNATAHLRGMAEEFGESTNAIRFELNNLSKAGYLIASEKGRTIQYRANTNHPLFPELKSLVHKHLGFDSIITNIIKNLGDLEVASVVGDYARGNDSGEIHLILVGQLDQTYLAKYVAKAEKLINRRVKTEVMNKEEFLATYGQEPGLILWDSNP